MMNDQILVLREDEQASIGTVGKIGLGVAAVAVAAVALFAVLLLSYDDGCED